MDFERATIKALFYDYTIEKVVKVICEFKTKGKDDYFSVLPHFVRWRTTSYTVTEARLMGDLLAEDWMNTDEGKYDFLPMVYRPLLLLRHVANDILEARQEKQEEMSVRFEHLFRWHDITLHVGEDLLTTAYIASLQANNPHAQNDWYLWPDMLPHNNRSINQILDRGISDVHAHMNATADVFALNWISVMNSLSSLSGLNRLKRQQYQDITLTTTDTKLNYSLPSMCIAAAWLRMLFFKCFIKNESVDKAEWRQVYQILGEPFYAEHIKKQEIQAEIECLRRSALRTDGGEVIDYAIRSKDDVREHCGNINIVFQGERELMISYLRAFYRMNETALSVAPYFYLYTLLKTRVRKELVQINTLNGFENFEIYQDRKGIFIDEDSPIGRYYDRIVVQTTLRPGKDDRLEARITPESVDKHLQDFRQGVFRRRIAGCVPDAGNNVNERVSYVMHFIKANYSRAEQKESLRLSNRDNYPRYDSYRERIKQKFVENAKYFKEMPSYVGNCPRVVGIDAASTEMFCRPEVFGQVFRYAKMKGIGRTYHVGEDFFDIVDGLRAMDEAILFLELNNGCRMGHALAMGVNAEDYYHKRRFRVIAPAQNHLDNCVWLSMRAAMANVRVSSSFRTALLMEAKRMYELIGYSSPFDEYSYWNSMLLRGNDPWASMDDDGDDSADVVRTDWQSVAFVDDDMVRRARKDERARSLAYQYNFVQSIKEKGEKRVEWKYQEEIIQVVSDMQEWMQRMVSHREIAVECNPSSNLKIGYFDEYKQHPLLTRFYPIEKQNDLGYPFLNASISTDDRGVFYTTAYNEFSLIAKALGKQKDKRGNDKYNPIAIANYIDRIRQNGFSQRFK